MWNLGCSLATKAVWAIPKPIAPAIRNGLGKTSTKFVAVAIAISDIAAAFLRLKTSSAFFLFFMLFCSIKSPAIPNPWATIPNPWVYSSNTSRALFFSLLSFSNWTSKTSPAICIFSSPSSRILSFCASNASWIISLLSLSNCSILSVCTNIRSAIWS